ncbi:hypothetical protein [Paenibacillus sp. KS-LC4]|uniref:hypothetical protein n=1 Tax=Paenibacillus sp. KS-LC4 TaxID=2979727 RepID=UPI0030D1CE19
MTRTGIGLQSCDAHRIVVYGTKSSINGSEAEVLQGERGKYISLTLSKGADVAIAFILADV